MRSVSRQTSRLNIVLIVLVTTFFALTSNQILKNPLRMDEVDYYQCMANTVSLGLPLYYAREEIIRPDLVQYLDTRVLGGHTFEFYRYKPESGVMAESYFALTDGNSRYTWCMWHPPLYVYLGSFVFRFFHLDVDHSMLIRYYNLVFSIGLFGGLAALSAWLYPKHWKRVYALALLFFVFSDLAVRGSVLIDYNATLAPCLAVWFVRSFLICMKRRRVGSGLIITTALLPAASFGVAASLLLGVVFLTAVWTVVYGWKRGQWTATLGVLAGIGVFLISFWGISQVVGLPFQQPFLHNFSRAGVQLNWDSALRHLTEALHYSTWYAEQIGLVVSAIALIFALKQLSNIVTSRSDMDSQHLSLPVFIVIGIGSQASLSAQAYGFPKYVLFILPLLFLYIAGEVTKLHSERRNVPRLASWMILAIVLSTNLRGLSKAVIEPSNTLYNRGETGVMAAGHLLSTLTSKDEVILCSKDVGFYAERKFVEWYGPYLSSPELLGSVMEEEQVRYAARSLPVSESVRTFLESRFEMQAIVGGYEILGPPTALSSSSVN